MASCLWRYRCRILLCICSPCVILGCLFIYIVLAVCLSMNSSISPAGVISSRPLPPFFIASGATNSGILASYPINSFWRYELNDKAHWNLIQHVMDRKHNPILQPMRNTSLYVKDLENSSSDSGQYGIGCSPNYEAIWTVSEFFTLPSLIQRFVISMHCRDYPILIDQPSVCNKTFQGLQTGAPMLLLAIKSQVENFENRQAIRRTWGRSGLVKGQVGKGGQVRRVFLLGKNNSRHDPDTVTKLKKESEKYGDLIMWDFLDTFFNLTLKDVLFWDWFAKHCQDARFVLKGDDDVFVRTPALLDYLNKEEEIRSNKTMEDFVVGDVITSAEPSRSENNKYFIPDSFYKGIYPSYAGGGGVVYSGALLLRLLRVSKKVHLFPIDDVYLGMCLQKLGVIPVHHPAFLTFDFPKDEAKEPCAHHTILLVHKRSPKEIQKLWSKTLRPKRICRNMPLRDELLEKKKSKQTELDEEDE